ncbi:hypothetical protein RJ639_041450 [Escallonia herrerae]|uniref:RING-type E3 ubiquitin transferase n=1 Tax=Escallonia herrerae TaxID=1293975 RepID=A0AA88WJQ4_9ASTE|nr:hypothetical protein RJ639_041450 [Escallonia herrerae]
MLSSCVITHLSFEWVSRILTLKEKLMGIMANSETIEGLLELSPSTSYVVAIALNGDRKSKNVVKWALEKFVPEGVSVFKLLHVRPTITRVPTEMGNSMPLTQVREDVAEAFRKEVEWQTNEKLLPYKKMFAQRKVQGEIFQIESDDVVNAIAGEVAKYSTNKLVIGASSRSIFSRILPWDGGDKVYRRESQNALQAFVQFMLFQRENYHPCGHLIQRQMEALEMTSATRAVLATPLQSAHPAHKQSLPSGPDDAGYANGAGMLYLLLKHICCFFTTTASERTDTGSAASYSHFRSPSLPMQRFQALSTVNQTLLHARTNSTETDNSMILSLDTGDEKEVFKSCLINSDNNYENSQSSSFRSLVTEKSWTSDQASTSDAPTDFSSEGQVNINFELEKLRIELRHIRGMYAIAESETIDASRKVNDLNKRRSEEAIKLKEINLKEEVAKKMAKQESQNYEAAKREAEYVKECAQREAAERKEAEAKAIREAREREKLENALVGPVEQYRKFEWEEIVSATSSFSDKFRIGMGAYGTVYKCSVHHTTAAVKVLHSKEAHRTKQFLQELEILSKIRHPHLLILLGACPDQGCLAYEYMENGSLEDRLIQKNNAPPIPWFERYRIAWEVASALVFLHNAKPKPIVHRDLKPANILLDHNLVSKIGDVGLSTMIPDSLSLSTIYKDTGPVGTLCYIDPEYQRTGLISPKSDVYAFGIVILQLLTAKPALAVAHLVQTAIDEDRLKEILDPEAGEWPIEETKELAILGLGCAELRRRDRPDLKDQVLPTLERFKEVADGARSLRCSVQPAPPNHFLCPILKEVMIDPFVAADGYTYERKAIVRSSVVRIFKAALAQ